MKEVLLCTVWVLACALQHAHAVTTGARLSCCVVVLLYAEMAMIVQSMMSICCSVQSARALVTHNCYYT